MSPVADVSLCGVEEFKPKKRLAPTVAAGWLQKRGPTVDYKWERRWCVLEPDRLFWYADESCRVKKGIAFVTRKTRAIAFASEGAPGDAVAHVRLRECGFVVDCDLEGGRSRQLLYFDAGDKHTLVNWLQAIKCVASNRLDVNPAFNIINLKMYDDRVKDDVVSNSSVNDELVELYYSMCAAATDLQVTTSCFTFWKKNNSTNGFAKVIPALNNNSHNGKCNGDNVRIFFFDDNLEFDGSPLATSAGICNLRDPAKMEFVDFAEGHNGFLRERYKYHTIVHHSSRYRNVLVKANVLDAIQDTEYYEGIIRKYSKPGEKLIIYMDVNGTIMCGDTGVGKDLSAMVLACMFELIVANPIEGSGDFKWNDRAPVTLKKPKTLKSLLKDVTAGDAEYKSTFWKVDSCVRYMKELGDLATFKWVSNGDAVTVEEFSKQYEAYLKPVHESVTKDGIATAWFSCFEALRDEHVFVLNSYGVDTRKVVLATVSDERQVIQITVNYELWNSKDVQAYNKQFLEQEPVQG